MREPSPPANNQLHARRPLTAPFPDNLPLRDAPSPLVDPAHGDEGENLDRHAPKDHLPVLQRLDEQHHLRHPAFGVCFVLGWLGGITSTNHVTMTAAVY